MFYFYSILPPGMIHDIFTPLSTLTVGRNFYCYETMRLTELALRLDRDSDNTVSDGYHWCAMAALARMVIAIPLVFQGM